MRFSSRMTTLCWTFFVVLATSASSCHATEGDMDPETYRELRKIEQGITRQTIAQGAFWGMQIGDPKSTVIQQLQRLGIEQIRPDILQQIRARSPKDLSRLRDADAVILFPGDAKVTFSGNQVRYREVLPSMKPAWKARLEAATTRGEVFIVLAEILEQDRRAEVGNYAPAARWIKSVALSDSDLQLLKSHDAWEFGHDNAEGFWNVRLEFASGQLAEINVQHSPVELP